MKKNILFFLSLVSYGALDATIVDGIQLPDPRTRDLVICNDSSEFYINSDPFPLPWTETSHAISSDLLYALAANQLVLSTKSLWHNVQFLAQLWLDFATLSAQQLTTKYQLASQLSAAEFAANLNRYQPCIKEIHTLYNIVNTVIATHHTQTLAQISHLISDALESAWNKNPVWLQEGDLKNHLQNLFTMFTLYQLALANNYMCKNVSDYFILFIPKHLTTRPALDPQLYTVTTQSNISNADIFLGLYNGPLNSDH